MVEELLGEQEPALHEGEPFAVPVVVVLVDEVIVVLPVPSPAVVRWVAVDAVDLSGVREQKGCEGGVVLAFDDNVCGRVQAVAARKPSRIAAWLGGARPGSGC